MLFNRRIDPSCLYCCHGKKISSTEIACLKRGIVPAGSFCRKFQYDPLKREPAKPQVLDTSALSEKDFEL